MALDTGRIGHEYPAWTHRVSRTKVHEYARALGEDDPRYHADDDTCVAPPTFAATFTLIPAAEALIADDSLGATWNLVHGGQVYEYGPRPLRPGDELSCTPRIADIRSRRGTEVLTVEVDCRFDADDELAVRSTGTIVFLGGDDDAEDADDGAGGSA